MAYGFIDDDLWHNPKARSFTPAEGWLWVLCISWTRKHKARGFISQEDALILAALHKLPRAKTIIDGLVAKHGLDLAPDGYVVHGYEEVYERQASAGRLGGLASGRSRIEAKHEAKPKQIASQKDEAESKPPTPTPTPTPIVKESFLEKPTEEEGKILQLAERFGLRPTREFIRWVIPFARSKGAKDLVAWLSYKPHAEEALIVQYSHLHRDRQYEERKEQELMGSLHRIGDVLAALPQRTA